MKVHVFQHVPFEGIGSMSSWLSKRQAAVTYTRFYESPSFPELRDLDLVIAMGGPMSVNDEAVFPWLRAEKTFISEAVRRGLPVIGICLGAQLVAGALGAKVRANPDKEIGWFEIEATPERDGSFRFPQKTTVFHWHGETFDLPPGSVRLARSAACENQAFQLGERVVGLQFHLEMTPEGLDSIIGNCRHELREGTFVQTEPEMRNAPDGAYENINSMMDDVLSYVTRRG